MRQRFLADISHTVVGATSHHVYVLPHPALRRHVAHYTVSFPGAADIPDTVCIVPDASGCIVCSCDGETVESVFWGPSSRAVTVDNDVNDVPVRVFVEFRPGGAYGMLTVMPLGELRDVFGLLDDIDPALSRAIECELERTGYDIAAFLGWLDCVFLKRLASVDDSRLVRHLLHSVATGRGMLPVRTLSEMTSLSERHLGRVCALRLGMNLKSFSRIMRINEACARLRVNGYSLTDSAHDLGYHDQSHFIHDFRSICGISPGEYRRRMSDFYNEELKLHGSMPEEAFSRGGDI